MKIGLILLFFLYSNASLSEGLQPLEPRECGDIYALLKVSQSEAGSLTTLRMEQKWQVDKSQWSTFKQALESKFGKLQYRDKATSNTRNVTVSKYSNHIDIAKGLHKDRKVKLRTRKYGYRKDNDPSNTIYYNDFFQTHSKVEFKFKHTDDDRVVFKPGIIMLDNDIKLLTDSIGSFYANIDAILERTINLSKTNSDGNSIPINNKRLVEEFLETIRKLHESLDNQNRVANNPTGLKAISEIDYEREAFEIIAKNIEDPNSPIKVQITVDRNINQKWLYKSEDTIFPEDWRAIEVKIPLPYARMSDQELAKVSPDLLYIRRHANELKQRTKIRNGAGKQTSASTQRKIQVRSDGVPLNLRQTTDIVDIPNSGTTEPALEEKRTYEFFQHNAREARSIDDQHFLREIANLKSINLIRENIRQLISKRITELNELKFSENLDDNGEVVLKILRALRSYDRKNQGSWLQKVIQDRFSLLNNPTEPISLGSLLNSIIDEYIPIASSTVVDGPLWKRVIFSLKKLGPSHIKKNWWRIHKFAKERGAKGYMTAVMKLPITIITSGITMFAIYNILNDDFDEKKHWEDSRKRIQYQKKAIKYLITELEKSKQLGRRNSEIIQNSAIRIKHATETIQFELSKYKHKAQNPQTTKQLKLMLQNSIQNFNEKKRVYTKIEQELRELGLQVNQLKLKKYRKAKTEYYQSLAALYAAKLLSPIHGLDLNIEMAIHTIKDKNTFYKILLDSLTYLDKYLSGFIKETDRHFEIQQ